MASAHVVPLRYLGILSDNMALTLGMAGAGEGGVAMIGVYLWVTVGNGFRFGPRYLLTSYWLSLLGFTTLLLFVPFWMQHRAVGIGLLLAIAIVPLYVLVLLIRLTAQKDAAEQLSNAKSRFVANVSHELRTPLTGVFAVYDLLRSRKMTPDDRELVGMLGSAVKTLKTSVDAVLQMSKLEAGAERADPRAFNLWYFLQQLAAMVRPQSAVKGLSWSMQLDASLPMNVVGDPNHLSHVLGNLLNNAFKFTATGGVSLRASCLTDDRIRFEVIDSGIGIPLDQQEHLFERFVQVDSSATRKYGGTGLGTSIARDLTELMGGKIGVISAPGNGSTFWIELTLPAPAPAAQPVEWGAVTAGPRRRRGRGRQSTRSSPRCAHWVSIRSLRRRTAGEAKTFDAQRYFAALLLMPAAEAAAFSETVLRERAGISAPWLVMSPSFSPMQRASLVAGGASALLPARRIGRAVARHAGRAGAPARVARQRRSAVAARQRRRALAARAARRRQHEQSAAAVADPRGRRPQGMHRRAWRSRLRPDVGRKPRPRDHRPQHARHERARCREALSCGLDRRGQASDHHPLGRCDPCGEAGKHRGRGGRIRDQARHVGNAAGDDRARHGRRGGAR